MEKEFIPYEQALELKELGFNEKCYGHYDSVGKLNTIEDYTRLGANILDMISKEFNSVSYMKEICSSPLYQQAFRWFREKHNYCYFIRGNNYDGYYYDIDNLGMLRYKIEIDNRLTWKTYEEAELECLKKLIEIIKP